jgi:hypothetical protein
VKDLEAVQAQYEAFKHKPPVARNMPPIAGNIMWSRQLLRRIEEPMQHFAQNKALMAMKESKKVIKMYNRVSTQAQGLFRKRLLVFARAGLSVDSTCHPPTAWAHLGLRGYVTCLHTGGQGSG